MSTITNHIKAAYSWSLTPFDAQNNKVWESLKKSRYPFYMLRYWFIYHMIVEEFAMLGTPLNCAEIGIHKGQMLYFMRDAEFKGIKSWVGIDCDIKDEAKDADYTKLIKADVESPDFQLDEKYDVIILLHVLEHLHEPEKLVNQLTAKLKPGGIVVGGFPVMPNFMIQYWQKRLRIVQGANGHVSAFSPQRVRQMAKDCGLDLEFMSGAFLCRNSGGVLEQSRLWMRFNLLYGALFFKSLGSELYWLMRKPG